jgi:hypothetical protein
MKEVERAVSKMDFLGLSTLTLIQDALGEIKRTEGFVPTSTTSRSTMRKRISCSWTARPTASSSSKARACAKSSAR